MIAVLALAGVLSIFGVLWAINAPEPPRRDSPRWHCDSMSPDGKYQCMESMAHLGWCRNGDIEWRYESWAVGGDDDTHAATPPLRRADQTERLLDTRARRSRRIPRPVFWVGLLLVVGVANLDYDNHHPAPVEKAWHCTWSVNTCTNWQ